MRRAANILFLLIIVAVIGYFFRAPITVFAHQAYQKVAPCTVPISYRVGDIDPRFGISETEVRNMLKETALAWGEAAETSLFIEKEERPVLTVNFIYDERQETTEKLHELGLAIQNNVTSYEAVKAKYNALRAEYDRKKAAFGRARTSLENRIAAYEKEVEMWNERGGAPQSAYQRLNREKEIIEGLEQGLVSLQNDLNADADSINTLVQTMNRIAAAINANASTYNAAGAGHEFEEGIFISRPGKEEINIFEFANKTKLARVLMHEFGHALGLDHVEDRGAIMYAVNEGTNLKPNQADTAELARVCRFDA